MDQRPATKYFIYARKSSEGDERQIQSVESQISELEELKKRLGKKVVETKTESHSAKNPGEREIFNKMLDEIRLGKADGLIVWHLDRLSRNAMDTGKLVHLMDTEKILEIITPTQTFRNTPNDKFMLNFFCSTAKLENDNKGLNVKRGLKAKAEKGWFPGPVPIGYINDPYAEKGNKTVLKDSKRFDIVKRMWEYMLTGQYTPNQILKIATDEWGLTVPARGKKPETKLSKSGVYRMFANPFHCGEFEYPRGSGNWIKGKHPSMINKNQYMLIQEMLSERSKPRPQKHNFTYTGLFECDYCGASITAEQHIKTQLNGNIHKYIFYRCTKQKKARCPEKYIEEKELEKQILNYLQKLHLPEELLDWALEKARIKGAKDKAFKQKLIKEKKQRIIELKEEHRDLIRLYSSRGNIDKSLVSEEQYKSNAEEIRKEINKLESNIYKLESSISKSNGVELFNLAQKAHDKFKNGTSEEKRRIIIDIYEKGIFSNKTLVLTLKPIFSLMEDPEKRK